MTFSARVTSKGQTTIPVAWRKRLGLKPGSSVWFMPSRRADELIIKRAPTIEEIRALNKAALKRAGTWNKTYYSGAGFEAYVMDKYGKRDRARRH